MFLKFNTDVISGIERTFLGGINQKFHKGVTDNFELEDIAKSLGFLVTIISRDEPQMIYHDGYYIINLDKAYGGKMISDHLFKHYDAHNNDVT
jgi:hypothetical protein